MAIKMRRGKAKDYDPSALVSGEIALIKDEKKMKVKFDDENIKEVQFKEDDTHYHLATDQDTGNDIVIALMDSDGKYQGFAIIKAGANLTGTYDSETHTLQIEAPVFQEGNDHKAGMVPDPGATVGTTKYLREDGTWQTPPNTTYSDATTSSSGLMSSTDKQALDNITSFVSSETLIGTYDDGSNIYNLYRKVFTKTLSQSNISTTRDQTSGRLMYKYPATYNEGLTSSIINHAVKISCLLYSPNGNNPSYIEEVEKFACYPNGDNRLRMLVPQGSEYYMDDMGKDITAVLTIEYYKTT